MGKHEFAGMNRGQTNDRRTFVRDRKVRLGREGGRERFPERVCGEKKKKRINDAVEQCYYKSTTRTTCYEKRVRRRRNRRGEIDPVGRILLRARAAVFFPNRLRLSRPTTIRKRKNREPCSARVALKARRDKDVPLSVTAFLSRLRVHVYV